MKENKILVVGAGFIGKRIAQELKCRVSTRRIRSYADAKGLLDEYRPAILINCIGSTGKNNIDDCELDKEKTIFANSFVPVILAEAAIRTGVKLVHISSGCIYSFDHKKDRPITEDMVPDFYQLFYSRTKIYAERALDTLSGPYGVLIARIRVPLDVRPHPRNILTKLISYRNVIDIPNSITYIPDFLKAIRHLIRIDAKGIYNIVNKGSLRYPQLMEAYRSYRPDFKYRVIDFKRLNLVRTNLILSTRKLEATGFVVRGIKEVLQECVKAYLKY